MGSGGVKWDRVKGVICSGVKEVIQSGNKHSVMWIAIYSAEWYLVSDRAYIENLWDAS